MVSCTLSPRTSFDRMGETISPPENLERQPSLSEFTLECIEQRIKVLAPKLRQIEEPEIIQTTRQNARTQYRELSEKNRESHERLREALEPVYLELAARTIDCIAKRQHIFGPIVARTDFSTVPYQLAALQPNLFDQPGRYNELPDTDEALLRVSCRAEAYHKQKNRGLLRKIRHKKMDGDDHIIDAVRELRAARDTGVDLGFSWWRYQELYEKNMSLRHGQARDFGAYSIAPDLYQNARFVAYRNNRDFTERGGFFEVTDGTCNEFILTEAPWNESVFTSQVRAPIGWYGHTAAKELAFGLHFFSWLIQRDEGFKKAVRHIANDRAVRPFLQQHLMRSHDQMHPSDEVEYGILHTALEGSHSIAALFSWIEADGIPGYELDLWGGLNALLKNDVPVMMTANMPQAVVVPITLHGKYPKEPLIIENDKFRIRPAVRQSLQAIQDRRIDEQYALWSAHWKAGGAEPIRYGLHCPYKASVVRAFAEALIACRAFVHDWMPTG